MKVLVYTALFADKDDSPTLQNWSPTLSSKYDFVCVTDNPLLHCDVHRVLIVKSRFSDKAKDSKYYKICGPPGMELYDVAIWHDASIVPDCEKLDELVLFSEKHCLSTFKHGREDVYLEAIACIENNKDRPIRVLNQMWRYYRAGLKAHSGLYENGILAINVSRYLSSNLKKVWWNEIENYSRRDQLSLPFAIQQTQTQKEIGILTGSGHVNPFSIYIGHQYDHYIDGSKQISSSSLLKKLAVALIYRFRYHSPARP